ncbi:TetR/AcrR family transcriptional regulator [Nocardiopsis sp. N85]|uniref:TetR/AcrR family transcriptional regulator n=1 Tax=Nocardiopsis sp. N85 TaxID=3029400 RepID=UPI00237FC01D|nr:TetR/AcrR family transcriptional regulator [Nocardiopsis sp. N85]MDE3720619.1 TetR/AcrR family transcriptional regulator [Nocardiopsis sp. N85]
MTAVQPPSGRRVGRKRGSYAKSEQKRRLILEAAFEVFAQDGYRSGSLRDIADRVQMSEAGLLHHFPNKSALLAAVLEHRDQRTADFFESDDPGDARTGLIGILRLTAYNSSVPGIVELYCTLSAEATAPAHPAHAYFVRRYDWIRGTVTSIFEALRDQGDLVEGVDPASAARSTIGLFDGLQVQWLLDREAVDMVDELRAHLSRLVNFEVPAVR